MPEQWYACTGGTEFQGRCRNQATGENQRCNQHPDTLRAPKPTGVSFKLQIPRQRSQVLEEAGIPRFKMDFVGREEREISQAKSEGREAYRYRDVADSGTAVFGKPGLVSVRLGMAGSPTLGSIQLLQELDGFSISNVDLMARRDGEMDHLRILLEQGVVDSFHLTHRAQEELRKLLTSTWQYCHVWANPPRNGKIVHTVNLLNRRDDPSKTLLVFRGGLWGVGS